MWSDTLASAVRGTADEAPGTGVRVAGVTLVSPDAVWVDPGRVQWTSGFLLNGDARGLWRTRGTDTLHLLFHALRSCAASHGGTSRDGLARQRLLAGRGSTFVPATFLVAGTVRILRARVGANSELARRRRWALAWFGRTTPQLAR